MRNFKAACAVFVAMAWCLTWRVAGAETNTNRFGIYLPRFDVYSGTSEITSRIVQYLRSKPEDIPLAEEPILSEKDLVSYDWETHTMELQKSIWFRVREPGVHGVPFVVVADGKPLFVGAFWNTISSVSSSVPVIMWDPARKSKTLTLQPAYPGPEFRKGTADPRENERLKKVLAELGKLKGGRGGK